MNMEFAFYKATSFEHELGGFWAKVSIACVCDSMFLECPGSIAGRGKSADGTPLRLASDIYNTFIPRFY